ncbi:hypothetical protein CRG98_019061 [Punica granatum]|uniref:Uncharacterized protein n=1 Tax=Punica granatum TaxID=22663 RepID=A0A2I0JWD0_PUNGR|nr:hypothetical protein CRG98_019061 [Punica granatum]
MLSSEQCTRHRTLASVTARATPVTALVPTPVAALVSARTYARLPRTSQAHMHARPRPARPRRSVHLSPRPSARLCPCRDCLRTRPQAELPPAPVRARARPPTRSSLPERASHAPKHPSKGPTESPDSQTLP